MRKSVLFLVGILYLVSIVVVTFFGMQARMDQFKVYVSSVEIVNEGISVKTDENGNETKSITIRFPNKDATEVSFSIQTKVLPENATNKTLAYTLMNSNGEPVPEEDARILSDGRISFAKTMSVTLIVTSTDGSSKSDSIKIRCRAAL